MFKKGISILCLCYILCGVTIAKEKVILDEQFDNKTTSSWQKKKGWTESPGQLVAGPGMNLLESKVKTGTDPDSHYVLEIYGFRKTKDTGTADNFWGLAIDSKNYRKGINFRIYKNTFSTNVWFPTENRIGESYHEGMLKNGQAYDFKIVWTPSKSAYFYMRKSGEVKWGKPFVSRLAAPSEPQRVVFRCSSGIEVKRIKLIENSYNKATLPKNILKVFKTKKSFGLKQFPIGFWNYVELDDFPNKINEQEVAEWAACGFTLPQGPDWNPGNMKQRDKVKKILDWCEKYGMKMIVRDRRCSSEEKIKVSYKDLGTHPATFGFHVADEPSGEAFPHVIKFVNLHKRISPKHHPFMNWWAFWPEWDMAAPFKTPAEKIEDYIKKTNSDLVCFDNYTQMWPGKYGAHPKWSKKSSGWDKYFLNLLQFRKASINCGIVYWATLLSVGHMTYRCPSFDDLRWQFNTAICAGASGIQWFYYYQRNEQANYRFPPIDDFWKKTQTWYDLQRIHKSFQRNYGDLFNRLVSTRVSFINKSFGNGKKFVPNGIVSQIKLNEVESYSDIPLLVGEFVDPQSRRYVMIVNLSMKYSACVISSFPGKNAKVYNYNAGKEFEVPCPGYAGKRNDKGVESQVWLAPGQEIVYRVNSESAYNDKISGE